MKNKLTLAFLFLFLVSMGCAYAAEPARESGKKDTAVNATAAPGTPVLVVPEWSFDFGEISEGNDYVHSFVIKNIGTGTLEIKKVVPG